MSERARVAGRMAAAVAAAALIGIGGAGTASAHASLDGADPLPGSTVATSPTAVTLTFSEAVGAGARSVEVVDAAGHRADLGNAHTGPGPRQVTVSLQPGRPQGPYTVLWHVVSADSHPVSGSFSYGVGTAAGAVPLPGSGASAPDGGEAVRVAHAAARGTALAGAVLLLGVALFGLLIGPGTARPGPHRDTSGLLRTGWWLTGAATVALLVLQGPYGAGLPLSAATAPDLADQTLTSRFGLLLTARLVLLAGAAVASRRGVPSPVLAGWLGVPFAVTFSAAAHAGTGPFAVLTTAVDAAHLLAACFWLGGLAVLGAVWLRERPGDPPAPDLLPALRRWSALAMGAVTVLTVTGAVQAWRLTGSPAILAGTAYGRLVLAKAAALAVLLVLADTGRRWVIRHASAGAPAGPAPLRRLRAGVVAELGAGLVVLAVTAVLVNTVPGRDDWAPPYSATVQAVNADGRPARLLVDIGSTRPGPTSVHLYVYGADGQVLPFATATGRLLPRGGGPGAVRFSFTPAGPGHAVATPVVPLRGEWSLVLDVQTDATTDYRGSTAVTVR